MEPISITTLALLLSPFFAKASETLATETVKLALEKRQDIKDTLLDFLKPSELITLGLNDEKSPEEIRLLVEANPQIAQNFNKQISENEELLNELLKVIKEQSGDDSSQITINAKNIAAAGNVKIEQQTNNFS